MSVEKTAIVRDTYLRYKPSERANHWVVVLCALMLMLAGLAFFHPSLFWLTNLFGGPQAARAIHPWIGVIMTVAFSFMGIRFFRQNIWNKEDTKWMAHIGDVIAHREDKIPEADRFNAAQKIVFYMMFWSVICLFLSGLVLWQHYFGSTFPVELQRMAAVLHALMAVAMIMTMIVHVYAAIWNAGSIRAMTRGPVTGGWLYKHHRKWLRTLTVKR